MQVRGYAANKQKLDLAFRQELKDLRVICDHPSGLKLAPRSAQFVEKGNEIHKLFSPLSRS